MGKRKPKPYNERTDAEKIQSQWVKLTGLHGRTDWSAAVVRAATATEITANLAIRAEYAALATLDPAAVDKKLIAANGLKGKMKLLLPLLKGSDKHEVVKGLKNLATTINDKRNGIVHRGEFCSKEQAADLIYKCEEFVHGVVRLYDPTFTLKMGSGKL